MAIGERRGAVGRGGAIMKGILATDEAKSKMGFVVTVFGQEQSSVLIFTNLPRAPAMANNFLAT